MNTIKLYITLEVPDEFFEDGKYEDNMERIYHGIDHIADLVDGQVEDVEIK